MVSPVTEEEFLRHLRKHGWPSVAETDDRGRQEAKTMGAVDWDSARAEGFNLWGTARAARNADRTGRENAFYMVGKGVHNYLVSLGKVAADA